MNCRCKDSYKQPCDILVSPSVSLHLLSSLRSVHRWWTHLHGAARRRWSCTKMHMQKIASMDKKKQSSVKRYGSDISWHEVPISRTLPKEPCPTGPPAGIICLKMWARKTSMSFPSDKEGEQAVPSLSFRDSLHWQEKTSWPRAHKCMCSYPNFTTLWCCRAVERSTLCRQTCQTRYERPARMITTWKHFVHMEPAAGTTHMWRSYPPVETFFWEGQTTWKKTASNVSSISSTQRIDWALAFR